MMIRWGSRRFIGALTRKEWPSVSPAVMRALEKAEFVSFDLEFSGLSTKSAYVGVDACYAGHAEAVKTFLPIQVGMCAARREEDSSWSLTPFSLYVFPSDEDRVFSASSSTMRFLMSNGVDLNAWIGEGVGWLRPDEENKKRLSIQSRIDELKSLRSAAASALPRPNTGPIPLPHEEDRVLINSVRMKVDEWLAQGSQIPLEIPMENAFSRLLSHTILSQEYPSLFSHSTRRGDSRVIVVFASKADLYKEQIESAHSELAQVSSALGVRQLFDLITERKLPLIGHNCFFDILHAFHHFYEDLPEDVEVFKRKWSAKFPRVYDTKYLSESGVEGLGYSHVPGGLAALADQMGSSTHSLRIKLESVGPAESAGYELPDSFRRMEVFKQKRSGVAPGAHDAGFDAMLTALVFLMQTESVRNSRGVCWETLSFKDHSQSTTIDDLFRTCLNKIRLVRTQPSTLNLAGKDRVVDKREAELTFEVIGGPADTWELENYFAPVNVKVAVSGDVRTVSVSSEQDAESILRLCDLKGGPLSVRRISSI